MTDGKAHEPESWDAGYDDGYHDALSDALIAVRDADDLDAARIAIMKLDGYVDCTACNGTGEREEITQADLAKALMADLGAIVDLSRPCTTCWGEKVSLPPKKTVADAIEDVRSDLAEISSATPA